MNVTLEGELLNPKNKLEKKFGLEEKVEFRKMRVYELTKFRKREFDLVLFMGVFYHLRYPLLALDNGRNHD